MTPPVRNGRFAIRQRIQPEGVSFDTPQFVLVVVYKGRPTQHIIASNEDGILTVNKRMYGDARTLKQVCTLIGTGLVALSKVY
jgi:hypothetical protein